MPTSVRRGQALIELALGLFVIALLSSAIFYFIRYMTKSLEIQNQIRGSAPVFAGRVTVDDFAAKEIFGMKNLHVKEPHGSTSREITNGGGLVQ